MSVKFENNTFKKRVKSMLGVDFRRMFTSPLFYIMVGASLVMPILILVMTTMMDGTVSVNPQTGAETVIEGLLDAEDFNYTTKAINGKIWSVGSTVEGVKPKSYYYAINYNNKSQIIVTVKNPFSQPQHTCPSVCALSSIRDQPNIPLKRIKQSRGIIGVVP